MRSKVNLRHIPLVIILCGAMGPLFFLFMNSLKTQAEFQKNPFTFPSTFTLENFITAWVRGNYGHAFLNSIIVGVICIVVVLVFGGLCAYALSKMDFKASNIIMAYLLFTMSIPMGLFLVPLFFIWQRLDLMNTLLGIIIIYSALFLPFNIFLLRSYFLGIPNEIIDCAKVDGCGDVGVLFRIVSPIAKPAFMTVALLVGLWTWNEFFFANAFLLSADVKTVATRYIVFTGRYSSDWLLIFASGVITILPIVILYIIFQRRFIEGMTEGSIK